MNIELEGTFSKASERIQRNMAEATKSATINLASVPARSRNKPKRYIEEVGNVVDVSEEVAIQNDVLVFRFLTRILFAISIFKLYYFLQIYKDNFNDEPANKNKSPGKRNPKRAKKQVVGSDDSAKQDDKTEFAAWKLR